MQVAKVNINVLWIRMLLSEGEVSRLQTNVWDLESSVDSSHFRLEKIEDHMDGFVSSTHCQTQLCMTNTWLMGLEIQRVQWEWRKGHEDLLLKLSTTGDVIDKKFICLDEELERVIDLVGQKIEAKFEEFILDYTETVAAEKQ